MPETLDIKQEELDALLERVKSNNLQEGDYELIKALVETVSYLSSLSDAKAASIKRLLKMLFGDKTEKVKKKPTAKSVKKPKNKKKGHGKNGASAYKGAKKVKVAHQTLKSGNDCPACDKGKLYGQKPPSRIVRVTGGAPLKATVYELQRLRCNLCGKIFTANPPDNIGEEKYDAKSGAILALLKYGSGVPLYRLGKLQASLGIPLPPSTQWEIIEKVADKIHPVYTALIRQAAQGDVLYNDDTTMKILSLLKETEKETKRKGMFTSGVLAKSDIDIMADFPAECEHVIDTLALIYKHDQETKDKSLTADQRLEYHQTHSRPLMQELKIWLEAKLTGKHVEPNSSLGKAMNYMLRHWAELTRFLEYPGAPLDNNLCEQMLKKSILHRKNSLFYKTEHGAYIGDLFMSLIHTCNLHKVNPFEYLTCLQDHSSDIFQNPETWLPWNFEKAIARKQKQIPDNHRTVN